MAVYNVIPNCDYPSASNQRLKADPRTNSVFLILPLIEPTATYETLFTLFRDIKSACGHRETLTLAQRQKNCSRENCFPLGRSRSLRNSRIETLRDTSTCRESFAVVRSLFVRRAFISPGTGEKFRLRTYDKSLDCSKTISGGEVREGKLESPGKYIKEHDCFLMVIRSACSLLPTLFFLKHRSHCSWDFIRRTCCQI